MLKTFVVKRQPKPKVFSQAETARMLKTSAGNIPKLIQMGKLKPLILGAKTIPEVEIDRFISENLGLDLNQMIEDWEANGKKVIV